MVVTNREDEIKTLLELHDQKGMTERRIAQFTREFLSHLPMGNFIVNWVYLLCAQLGYNLALWIWESGDAAFLSKETRETDSLGHWVDCLQGDSWKVPGKVEDLGTSSLVARLCL